MRRIKQFFDLAPAMIMWLMLSIFLWGFVFNFLTDAPAQEKITLFIDAPLAEETALAVRLEEGIQEPVRMVQVRAFSYAMMSSDGIENADLYIIGESQLSEYQDWFAPLPEGLHAQGEVLEVEGVPLGLKVYDAATGQGAAARHIGYTAPGKANEDHYLFLGRSSLHLLTNENAVDDQAVTCALQLIALP